MKYWVWVFGEIEGLRWVLGKRMAFPEHAASPVAGVRRGARAVLYVIRGAFHNPTRDEARLAGLATVASTPRQEDPPPDIAGREFTCTVPIHPDVLLPEQQWLAVRPLAAKLSLVRKPDKWGLHSSRPKDDRDTHRTRPRWPR